MEDDLENQTKGQQHLFVSSVFTEESDDNSSILQQITPNLFSDMS